jgi:hypothetical protein
LELRVSSFSARPRKIEEKIESHEEALENLRQEVERQRESIDGKVAVVVSRADELLRQFEKLRGGVQAVKDSVGGEIGKLKSETAEVAKSVTGLETLRREFEDLKVSLERLQHGFTRVGSPKPGDSSSEGDKAASQKPVSPVQQPTPNPSRPMSTQPPRSVLQKPSPSVSSKPEKPQSKVEIPMKSPTPVDRSWDKKKRDAIKKENEAKSLDGIVSYLTKKHGGNVREKGIVTITSKSVYSVDPGDAPTTVADLTSDSYFWSKGEPGQWVCWDFREMRVRSTRYTIKAEWLKSWVVEGSLDGNSWMEIDRQTDNLDFKNWWNTVSFAVSKPVEFRFIRLTQTDKNQCVTIFCACSPSSSSGHFPSKSSFHYLLLSQRDFLLRSRSRTRSGCCQSPRSLWPFL